MSEIILTKQAKIYEIFIRKTFREQRIKRYESGIKIINELPVIQQHNSCVEQRVPCNRKLFKIKLNVQKVLIKLKKKKEYKNSHDQFTHFIVRLQDATTLDEIIRIINKAMSKVIEIENEMKQNYI
jgi:hypothetical protein